MNDFFKAIVRTAVLVCACAGIVLLIVGGVLLFAPELMRQILRYGLVLLCLAGGAGLIVYLIRLLLSRR